MLEEIKKVGFKITEEIKMWPKDDRFGDEKVGDFIFVLELIPA